MINQMFTVPNNEEGKLFICLMKKYLNKETYNLRQRGRRLNHDKVKKAKDNPRCYHQHVPLKYADNIGVYPMAKRVINGKKRTEVVGVSSLNTADYYRDKYCKNFANEAKLKAIKRIFKLLNEFWKEEKKMIPVCNACDSIDDFCEENEMGYCYECYQEVIEQEKKIQCSAKNGSLQ